MYTEYPTLFQVCTCGTYISNPFTSQRLRRQTRLCSFCQWSCWHSMLQYAVFQQQW